MPSQTIESIAIIFQSRLTTLEHLLQAAQTHFDGSESFLKERIVADMLPFGTQVAFTCNQPRNFALWCDGNPMDNLNPEVLSLEQARKHITETKKLLSEINTEDRDLNNSTRIELSQELHIEMSGNAYVDDFLLPNFYFHLVTAYDILRKAGVPIGKRDYMMHLVPFLQQR